MPKSKKELDKDVMYSKIMPTAPRAPIVDEPPPPTADELSRLKAKLFNREPMDTMDGGTVLVNLTENAVASKLDETFSKFSCCKCDRCKKDVIALALNRLPAHYVIAEPSEIPNLDCEIPAKEVSAALIQAVLKVRTKPRH